MVTPLERYRDKQKRDAEREEARKSRGLAPEWAYSPIFNWFVTVVVIGFIGFYYSHHRICIDDNQRNIEKTQELVEDIRARLSVTYVFYQKASSLPELFELRKQGADVQNAALGTSSLFYSYRQLLRAERDFVDGEIVDEYTAAASNIIFPGKPFREAMSDAAVLLSTDVLPDEVGPDASYEQVRNLALRSIQLLLFQVNFIDHQMERQSCSPTSILSEALFGKTFAPVIVKPTQLPPPAQLTAADVYATAPIPELAPKPAIAP